MYTPESIEQLSKMFLEANAKLFKVKTVNEKSDIGSIFCYKCQNSKAKKSKNGGYTPNMYCLKGGFMTTSFCSCVNGIEEPKEIF